MPDREKIRVAVVGLGFGAAFVPLYRDHPNVAEVVICDTDEKRLADVGERQGIARRYPHFEEVIADDGIDAVHLLTPITFHVEQTVAVLEAGKHCACAVPMATSIGDLRRIIEVQQRTGRNYMMMETAVYTREFLFVQDLFRQGRLGNLTFLRGAHLQNLEGWPDVWKSVPPMHYATHAVAPILALTGTRAATVNCLGSGTLRPDLQQPGANPYPLQTALLRLAGTDLAAEVTRCWFQTARPFSESFTVYGDRMGFEWQQLMEEEPLLFTLEPLPPGGHRGRPTTAERVACPDRPDLLPPSLHPFMRGGHGGSHPHLVHEFVSSIIENRPPRIDAVTAADWCAPGICAHESALRNGEAVPVPKFGEI